MCIEQIAEIRNWVLLLLGTVGAFETVHLSVTANRCSHV